MGTIMIWKADVNRMYESALLNRLLDLGANISVPPARYPPFYTAIATGSSSPINP